MKPNRSRLAALAAAAAFCAACASSHPAPAPPPPSSGGPPTAMANRHEVSLKAEKQSNGRWKALAEPDHLMVRHYDRDRPDSVVVWKYRHKATTLVFRDSRIQANVKPCERGECVLVLPPGLDYGVKYKYTIKGKLDDTTDLEDNDPDIEVDR